MKEGKIIFKCRTGSHLYGLNNENSDEDFVGVFIPNEEYILGLKNIDEVDNSTKKSSKTGRNTKDDVDEKLYSRKKYLNLC
jgi:predicted nucleotidyltransferase